MLAISLAFHAKLLYMQPFWDAYTILINALHFSANPPGNQEGFVLIYEGNFSAELCLACELPIHHGCPHNRNATLTNKHLPCKQFCHFHWSEAPKLVSNQHQFSVFCPDHLLHASISSMCYSTPTIIPLLVFFFNLTSSIHQNLCFSFKSPVDQKQIVRAQYH